MKEYDEYGFDEYGIHRDTKTQFDDYGFNKTRTIHKDTGTPKNKNGHYRRDYGLTKDICPYSDAFLRNLFFNTVILNFNGEKFIDAKLNYEKISKIELSSFDAKTINYFDRRPTKLDGTPDYRYNSSEVSSTQHTTSYNIIYHIKNQSKKVTLEYTSKAILLKRDMEKYLERYNSFFVSIESDIEFKNLYKEFLSVREECIDRSKEVFKLKIQKKDYNDIYNKLTAHKDKFTEEQNKQFENLKKKIKDIDNNIDKEENFQNIFDDIYKKLDTKLKAVEKNFQNSKIDNEIDDLFNQLK